MMAAVRETTEGLERLDVAIEHWEALDKSDLLAFWHTVMPIAEEKKKVFVELKGRPVWVRTAEMFVNRDDVVQTILVLSPDDVDWFKEKFRPNIAFMNIEFVTGGAERADVVRVVGRLVGDQLPRGMRPGGPAGRPCRAPAARRGARPTAPRAARRRRGRAWEPAAGAPGRSRGARGSTPGSGC